MVKTRDSLERQAYLKSFEHGTQEYGEAEDDRARNKLHGLIGNSIGIDTRQGMVAVSIAALSAMLNY